MKKIAKTLPPHKAIHLYPFVLKHTGRKFRDKHDPEKFTELKFDFAVEDKINKLVGVEVVQPCQYFSKGLLENLTFGLSQRSRKDKMNVRTALRRIRKHRPENATAFELLLGVKLKPVGEGAFRGVYQMGSLPLVVKIPLTKDWLYNKQHSAMEVRKLKRLKKFRCLRLHLPTLYYYDRRTGIVIMTYYEEVGTEVWPASERKASAMYSFAAKLIKSLTGVWVSDIAEDNVRTYKNNIKLVDLAL